MKRLGKLGEELAVDFLKQNKYCILARNFRIRSGEIDIIAKEDNTICFVEVKARATSSHGSGFEAVSQFKRRKISKVALYYLQSKKYYDVPARFDVISIKMQEDGPPKIELLRNAFDCIE